MRVGFNTYLSLSGFYNSNTHSHVPEGLDSTRPIPLVVVQVSPTLFRFEDYRLLSWC